MGTRVPERARWRTPDALPPQRKQCVELLEVGPEPTKNLVILSNKLYEVWTHHVFKPGDSRGRTKPCTGEQGECEYDHRTTSMRYMAWLVVKRIDVHEQRLLRLTLNAIYTEPRLREPGRDLRGLGLEVGRINKRSNGPMYARLDADSEAACLIADVDIPCQLERMWNAPARKVNYRLSLRDLYEKMGVKPGEATP